MNLRWLYRISERRHPLVVPLMLFSVLAIVNSSGYFLGEGGFVREEMPIQRVVGTLMLYNTMPCYLLFAMVILGQRVQAAATSLQTRAPESNTASLLHRLYQVHPLCYPMMLMGCGFGAYQNNENIAQLFSNGGVNALDILFVVGNCILWTTVALLLAWRIPAAIQLARFGASLKLDLFRPDLLKPYTRVPTTDILFVAGAMAIMPLQALDAEFRFDNYQAGLIVGSFSAIVLFVIPMLGLRANIQRHKEEQLVLLYAQLDAANKNDLTELEPLLSHIDRFQGIPAWPVDIQLVFRVAATLIIPPSAWVAAALVENFVDNL